MTEEMDFCTCDMCGEESNETLQRPDFPGVRDPGGSYRSAWICFECVPFPEEDD